MPGTHVAVVPVGKVDPAEIEAALSRVAKVLRQPVELRGSLPVPRGAEDTERGQFRAATVMGELRSSVARLGPGKMIGSDDPEAKAPPMADAYIFVTDVDLFTAKTDGVFAALISARQVAVISVRRLREAYYRRPADPAKQRARVVKEILRMAGRLRGTKECSDPQCAMAPSKVIPDLDTKEETYCRVCSQNLFEGRIRI